MWGGNVAYATISARAGSVARPRGGAGLRRLGVQTRTGPRRSGRMTMARPSVDHRSPQSACAPRPSPCLRSERCSGGSLLVVEAVAGDLLADVGGVALSSLAHPTAATTETNTNDAFHIRTDGSAITGVEDRDADHLAAHVVPGPALLASPTLVKSYESLPQFGHVLTGSSSSSTSVRYRRHVIPHWQLASKRCSAIHPECYEHMFGHVKERLPESGPRPLRDARLRVHDERTS